MTKFQAKVEQLLKEVRIAREHYEAAQPFFGIEHSEPIRVELNLILAELFWALSDGNRGLNAANVQHLINHMLRGEFHDNSPMMGFDDEGTFRDGHHRCVALLKANEISPTSILVYVRFNQPGRNFASIDTGVPRRLHEDYVFNKRLQDKLSHVPHQREITVVRYYFGQGGGQVKEIKQNWSSLDNGAITELIVELKDELEFIRPFLKRSSDGMTLASLAAFMRAWSISSEDDKRKIELFLEMMYDEGRITSNDCDEMMRRLFMQNSKQKARSGGAATSQLFNRTLWAIEYALNGNYPKTIKIKDTGNDHFPLSMSLLSKLESFSCAAVKQDFEILPFIHRLVRTQEKRIILKNTDIAKRVVALGYVKPESTIVSRLRKVMRASNFCISVPGAGLLRGIGSDRLQEQHQDGKRVRCEEYVIQPNNDAAYEVEFQDVPELETHVANN